MKRSVSIRPPWAGIAGLILLALMAPRLGAQPADDWLDLERPPEEAICFVLYTVQDNVLKMTVQCYPLDAGVGRAVTLSADDGDGAWNQVASAIVDETPYGRPLAGLARWTAHLRVDEWDESRRTRYRVEAADGRAALEGIIRADPINKQEIVVASLSCNSNQDHGPRPDLVRNLLAHDPDLLFFAGDQVYDHTKHLQSWLAFGRQFGEVTKDRPTVCIPDDHDVGQSNLWGEAGMRASNAAGADGGFTRSPEYVNSVQRAQTWHLPDPYDPTPVHNGIGVYYTAMRVGSVSFAIIEDRKFKTGPLGLVPLLGRMDGRPDHVVNPIDPQLVDVPEARLLGRRQLAFLRAWGQDWRSATMKCVLSQTVFAYAAQIHGPWTGPGGGRFSDDQGSVLAMDLDSNGWPQTGRRRALEEIRRCHALMLCGDQHLATVVHHGINNWRDAGVSFTSPAIQNVYVRRWMPTTRAQRPIGGVLPLLGDYFDGFGNKMSMLAYANAREADDGKYAEGWGRLAEGHALVRFNTNDRTMTLECWPRGVDVTQPNAPQYPGWPLTLTQADMYAREPAAWLPEIEVVGVENPVVQVISETYDELMYTIRAPGRTFRPHTFIEGPHTIRVGQQPGRCRVLTGVAALRDADDRKVVVDLTSDEMTQPWEIGRE